MCVVVVCAAWWRARGRGARGYTYALDVGLLVVGVLLMMMLFGMMGGVDVFGLNFLFGSLVVVSVLG